MPFYYFDIIDNSVFSRDEFGLELHSFEKAREQAQVLLPDIARSELPDGEKHTFVCEVREGERGIVYRGRLVYQGTVMHANPSAALISETST